MSKLGSIASLLVILVVGMLGRAFPSAVHAQENFSGVAYYLGGSFAVPVPEGWYAILLDESELWLTNQPNATDIPESLLPGEAVIEFNQWYIWSQVSSASIEEAADFLLSRGLPAEMQRQGREAITVAGREGVLVRVLHQEYSSTNEAVASETAASIFFIAPERIGGLMPVITLMYHPDNDSAAQEAMLLTMLETALTTPADTLLPRQTHPIAPLGIELLLPSEFNALPDEANGAWYFSNRAGATLDEIRDYTGIQAGELILKVYTRAPLTNEPPPVATTIASEIVPDYNGTYGYRTFKGWWISGTVTTIDERIYRQVNVFARPEWSQAPFLVVEAAAPIEEFNDKLEGQIREILTRIRPITGAIPFPVDLSNSIDFNGLNVAYPAQWENTIRPEEPAVLYLSNQVFYASEAPFGDMNPAEVTYALMPDAAAQLGIDPTAADAAQLIISGLAEQITTGTLYEISERTLGNQTIIIADVVAPMSMFAARIYVNPASPSAAVIAVYDNRFDPDYYVDGYAEALLATLSS